MNDGVASTAERVVDLFQGARLTPTQRRIAHSLVQHAPSAAYLSAAEVAELAGFMLTKATFMVGSVVLVDGGTEAQLRPDAYPVPWVL